MKKVIKLLPICLIVLLALKTFSNKSDDPTGVFKSMILSPYNAMEIVSSFKNLKGYDLEISYDSSFVYIQSIGLPNHPVMKGITGWNSQTAVPYSIRMKIPVGAVFADNTTPHRIDGPIAIAVNGIPIFEPTKQGAPYNDSGDPLIQGELDSCGGHSGRGDDYHYHIAPKCIMDELKPNQPIAWSLDGFPIFGFKEIDGKDLDRSTLDSLNGHTFKNRYHYHASPVRPYINKGFRGKLDPDILPTVRAIRPTGKVIRTMIIDYYTDTDGWTVLKYKKNGGIAQMNFRASKESKNCYDFVEIDESGAIVNQYKACRR